MNQFIFIIDQKMKPNKHNTLFSKIRSVSSLVSRSPTLSLIEKSAFKFSLKNEITLYNKRLHSAHALESLDIIYPPISLSVFKSLGILSTDNYKDIKAKLGYKSVCREPTELDDFLSGCAKQSRYARWKWRIGRACFELKDWFPFFITLTVDPKIIDPVQLWKEGKVWQKYIKRLADISMIEAGLNNKQRKLASVRDYLHYVAVVETGKSEHHAHIHALVFFKNLPPRLQRDPNNGLSPSRSVRRRCPELEQYWPYSLPGLSPVIYFRYQSDVWSKLNHKIPLTKSKKSVLMPPQSSGLYLIKYLTKGDKTWNHRIKSTRGLGLSQLVTVLQQMPTDHLKQLVIFPPTMQLMINFQTRLSIPRSLVTCIAKAEIYKRIYHSMSLNELLEERHNIYLTLSRTYDKDNPPWRQSSLAVYRWLEQCIGKSGFCESLYNEALDTLSYFNTKSRVLSVLQGV